MDIPCSLCPVVAILQLIGNCVTLSFPSLIFISLLCDENGKSIVAPTLSSFNRKIFSRLWPVWGNGKIQHIQRLVLILSKLFDYPNFFHICHVPGLSLTVLN